MTAQLPSQPVRRLFSSLFTFAFTVSAVMLLMVIWTSSTLSDTDLLEDAVAMAAESEALAAPLIDAATSALAEKTALPEDTIRGALIEVWNSSEADDLRQELASSLVALAAAEQGLDQTIDLTEVAQPLVERVALELIGTVVGVTQEQVKAVIAELGPTVIEVEADEIPFAGRLFALRFGLSWAVKALTALSVAAAILATLCSTRRRARVRKLFFIVAGCSIFVAGLMWVVGYFSGGLIRDADLGAALSSVCDAKLTPLLVVGVISLAIGLAIRDSAPDVDFNLPDAPVDPNDPWAADDLRYASENNANAGPLRAR
jgi:hypothetical protein